MAAKYVLSAGHPLRSKVVQRAKTLAARPSPRTLLPRCLHPTNCAQILFQGTKNSALGRLTKIQTAATGIEHRLSTCLYRWHVPSRKACLAEIASSRSLADDSPAQSSSAHLPAHRNHRRWPSTRLSNLRSQTTQKKSQGETHHMRVDYSSVRGASNKYKTVATIKTVILPLQPPRHLDAGAKIR